MNNWRIVDGAWMSHYEKLVLQKLSELYRLGGCGYVRTLTLADHLGKYDRTIRLYLVRLEKRGKVVRKGQRGGWMPIEPVGNIPMPSRHHAENSWKPLPERLDKILTTIYTQSACAAAV